MTAMTPARLEQLAAALAVYDSGLRPGETFAPPDLAEVARALAWAAAEIGRRDE